MSFVPAPGVKPTPTASSASTSNAIANTTSSPSSPLSSGGITGLKNIVLQWTPACGTPSDGTSNTNNNINVESSITNNNYPRITSTTGENEADEGEVEDEDDVWLRSVWRDFYEADTPFLKFEVHDIYSFFHRRHQLKYRALEITDKQGQSILFSCSSVEVCWRAEYSVVLASFFISLCPFSLHFTSNCFFLQRRRATNSSRSSSTPNYPRPFTANSLA